MMELIRNAALIFISKRNLREMGVVNFYLVMWKNGFWICTYFSTGNCIDVKLGRIYLCMGLSV